MSQRRLSGGLHGRGRADPGEGQSDHEAQERVRRSRIAAAAHHDANATADADDVQTNANESMDLTEEHAAEGVNDEDEDSEDDDSGEDDDDDNDDDDFEHSQLLEVDGQVYRVVIETDEAEADDEDDEQQQDDEDVDDGGAPETEVEEEDEGEANDRSQLLRMLLGGGYRTRGRSIPEDIPRLPVPITPLQTDLAAQINRDTGARDIGQSNDIWASLDAGFDSSQASLRTTRGHRRQQLQQLVKKVPSQQQQEEQEQQVSSIDQSAKRHCAPDRLSPRRRQQQQQDAEPTTPSSRSLSSLFHSATSIITRSSSRRAAAAEPAGDCAAPAPAVTEDPESNCSSSTSDGTTGFKLVNTAQMLFKREVSLGKQFGFSRTQQRHMVCHRALPLHPQQIRDTMQSRAYIGQYSGNGDFYIAAFQDRRVRLYDTQHNWRLRKDVTTRMTRWTITDTTLSPDQRLLVYASISPVAFVVNVGSSYDVVESQANITELHEPLAFDGSNALGADERRQRRGRGRWADSDEDEYEDYQGRDFGLWSIAWSPQGGQLIGGTNDNSVYVYDIESKRCLVRLSGHSEDVNAVAYLHGDTNSGNGGSGSNPHIVVSGSDDSMVRVWDLRDKSGSVRAPTGVLVGHTEGMTHICPKGDGLHLISNSKDQTIKLWDVRAALSPAAAATAARDRPRIARWDYRWEDYPGAGYAVKHPGDVSVMTYRGHTVLQTLIRAYFSPMHTTGQRYIYAGSSDGIINAWDVVSGKPVAQFEYHRAMVRDCSWHPYEPEMTSVSWDGSILSWGPGLPPEDKLKQLGTQGRWGDVGRYY